MSEPIIRVENLGKRYSLRHQNSERYTALRDVLTRQAKRLFRRNGQGNESNSREDFWALRDVNFEVRQGEVVGIIGRNGAGKSTLLKILSRITEPTAGRIIIKGRVASLLEVGTGFHPELTGRENIFLNGAILGMHRTEIKAKFDEIVAFAEVEKFLDTPVKRYSSGMYVRLAFAVAAHLEPEILVVDEVLAVGDAEFQKKCLGKMQQVSTAGRTVLFVSHNMGTVQKLCQRGLLLRSGSVLIDGRVTEAIDAYLHQNRSAASFENALRKEKPLQLVSGELEPFSSDAEAITVHVCIKTDRARSVAIDVRIANATGIPVAFGSVGTFDPKQSVELSQGCNHVWLTFPVDELANGSYKISMDVAVPFQEYLDTIEHGFSFILERAPMYGREHRLLQDWGHGSVELPLAMTRPVSLGLQR